MEDASGNPGEESDEAPETRDVGQGCMSIATDTSSRALDDDTENSDYDYSREMEPDEQDTSISSEDQPGRVKSRSSYEEMESQEEETDSRPESGVPMTPLEEITEPPSSEGTELSSSEAASKHHGVLVKANSFGLHSAGPKHPAILGRVRRESSTIYTLSREALETIAADTLQIPSERSVSMQTDKSWLYDHVYKKKKAHEEKRKRGKDREGKLRPEDEISAVLARDPSSLEILCDMEFKEEFLKLFQDSLRTLSSVGPPTVLAYRPESTRKVFEVKLERGCVARCPFCGSLLQDFPSFESLEKLAEYGALFCCQQCRELQEFLVLERMRYAKEGVPEQIDVAPHKAHGSEADREKARERARQRMRERQLAKQFAYLAKEQEKDVPVVHTTTAAAAAPVPEYNRQLKTISYTLSQHVSSDWTKYSLAEDPDYATYVVSYCDFTIAGGKLLKNIFLQQYYKNGVKFLIMFPDGTAQIFYPSGNLAIIIVKKKADTGYICIVQGDQPENAAIQAVLDSCGKVTCYHPNGLVWINITLRGGHYSDQSGNKVRTWYWPNDLQRKNPSVKFKPVFLSLNQNVGVRILGQDKVVISFLAMGKQAKINIGTKVEPTADHHPWPKYVSEDDLMLFASRIRILKIFARFHGCIDFPTNNQWVKLEIPSYISKQSSRLMHLCKECEVATALDDLITTLINSTN